MDNEKQNTDRQASELRERAKTAAQAHARSALTLAAVLFEVYYGTVRIGSESVPLVRAWKYDDFHEYAEHELQMHGTTAYGYVAVHDTLILGAGLDPKDLPPSITKLRQLARIAREKGKSITVWIKRAHDMGCCEFQNAVDEHLGLTSITHSRLNFYIKSTQASQIQRNIKRAKESLGTKTNGETLATIVKQWSDLNDRSSKIRKVS